VRTFAKAERFNSAVSGKRWIFKVKEAADFRHWAHRPDLTTYGSKGEAEEAAMQYGYEVVDRWTDVKLTKGEAEASGYYS
jgi:hypothetical protein